MNTNINKDIDNILFTFPDIISWDNKDAKDDLIGSLREYIQRNYIKK